LPACAPLNELASHQAQQIYVGIAATDGTMLIWSALWCAYLIDLFVFEI